MKILTLFFVLLLTASVCGFADEAQPFPEEIPSHFEFTYAHEMGACYSIKGNDGKLVYSGNGGISEHSIVPSPEQWTDFLDSINKIKAYRWDKSYHASPTAMDGGFHWQVAIQTSQGTFFSEGDTAFPLDGDIPPDPAKKQAGRAFDLFVDAVKKLAGMATFY